MNSRVVDASDPVLDFHDDTSVLGDYIVVSCWSLYVELKKLTSARECAAVAEETLCVLERHRAVHAVTAVHLEGLAIIALAAIYLPIRIT